MIEVSAREIALSPPPLNPSCQKTAFLAYYSYCAPFCEIPKELWYCGATAITRRSVIYNSVVKLSQYKRSMINSQFMPRGYPVMQLRRYSTFMVLKSGTMSSTASSSLTSFHRFVGSCTFWRNDRVFANWLFSYHHTRNCIFFVLNAFYIHRKIPGPLLIGATKSSTNNSAGRGV